MVQQIVNENGTEHLPPLKRTKNNMVKYDLAPIGFLAWNMKMAHPIKSFSCSTGLRKIAFKTRR
jgi:hypothetical protein